MKSNNKLTITTFAETPEQIELFINNGVKDFIIEDPIYSTLCRKYTNREYVDITNLENLITTINKSKKDAKIIFNIDIIAHNRDFDILNNLFRFLLNHSVTTARVMDIGILNYMLREFPEMKIQLNTETGNNNYLSVQVYKDKIGNRFDKIILSKELEHKHIKDIISKTNIKSELQAHGLVMLLYTRRRVLNELDAFKNKENMHYAEISEAKRNDEYFTVIDNNHGSFMLHSKHICLLEEIPIIIDVGISSILIDLRGYEPHIISETVKIYNEAIEYYLKTGNSNLSDFKKMLPDTGKEFFKGFFLENNTDKISKKTVTYNLDKEQNKKTFIGEIIDFVKEKTVTIKIEKPISIGDRIFIDTPEGKLIELKIDFIKTLDSKYINKTEQFGLYTINWKKGIVNRSYVYYNKQS